MRTEKEVAAFPCSQAPEPRPPCGGCGRGTPLRPRTPRQGGPQLQENVATNTFPSLYILTFIKLLVYMYIYIYTGIYICVNINEEYINEEYIGMEKIGSSISLQAGPSSPGPWVGGAGVATPCALGTLGGGDPSCKEMLLPILYHRYIY